MPLAVDGSGCCTRIRTPATSGCGLECGMRRLPLLPLPPLPRRSLQAPLLPPPSAGKTAWHCFGLRITTEGRKPREKYLLPAHTLIIVAMATTDSSNTVPLASAPPAAVAAPHGRRSVSVHRKSTAACPEILWPSGPAVVVSTDTGGGVKKHRLAAGALELSIPELYCIHRLKRQLLSRSAPLLLHSYPEILGPSGPAAVVSNDTGGGSSIARPPPRTSRCRYRRSPLSPLNESSRTGSTGLPAPTARRWGRCCWQSRGCRGFLLIRGRGCRQQRAPCNVFCVFQCSVLTKKLT